MGLEDVKMFQILSNGKVKELTEKEYLKRLNRKGYLVGWIGKTQVLFSLNGEVVNLHRHQVQQIFSLFNNKKEA